MTGGSISCARPRFTPSVDIGTAVAVTQMRKKREPKPPRKSYKTVAQILAQPIVLAADLDVLALPRDNTTRKRLEEKGLFPQRRMMPGCQRMVFYRGEDIIAHLAILNNPRWDRTDAHYLEIKGGSAGGSRNAS